MSERIEQLPHNPFTEYHAALSERFASPYPHGFKVGPIDFYFGTTLRYGLLATRNPRNIHVVHIQPLSAALPPGIHPGRHTFVSNSIDPGVSIDHTFSASDYTPDFDGLIRESIDEAVLAVHSDVNAILPQEELPENPEISDDLRSTLKDLFLHDVSQENIDRFIERGKAHLSSIAQEREMGLRDVSDTETMRLANILRLIGDSEKVIEADNLIHTLF